MLASALIAERGKSVILLEPNQELGRKLRITGKGRCNLTNACEPKEFIQNVPQNGKFLHSAINALSPSDTMKLFEKMSVKLKVERGRRVFPESDSAAEVVAALENKLLTAGVQVKNIPARRILTENGAVRAVSTPQGGIPCDAAIICTGGASYTATGSTGDGYKIAIRLGHTVTEILPSLVPLVSDGGDCERLMGLSLRNVKLRAMEDEKCVFEEQGELLFTHFGLSGPLVLSASAHMRKFDTAQYKISIDLKPALDEAELDRRLLADFSKRKNSDFINSLDELLPKKIIPVIVARSGIGARQKVNSITKEQRASLLRALKAFEVPIRAPRPINEAIITRGGVDVREIDPRTMQSRLVSGLYFAGEIIDTDAYTGGYNLQIAWSTAYLAARAI